MTGVCCEPNCGRDPVRKGRCREHQLETRTTTEQGYGWSYQIKRAAFLRTHHTCRCGAPATTVHHRLHNQATEAGNDPRFWEPMCTSCNSRDGALWARPGA